MIQSPSSLTKRNFTSPLLTTTRFIGRKVLRTASGLMSMLTNQMSLPLAIQGPKAEDLMARVFGESVRDIKFFKFRMYDFLGQSMAIARSGYSKQGWL